MNKTFKPLNDKKYKSLNYLAGDEEIFTGSTHHEWAFVGGPMDPQKKSKMAAAAIFNFGKNFNDSGLDKDVCTKFYGKMHHAEMNTWPVVKTER